MVAQPQTKFIDTHKSLWTYIFESKSLDQSTIDEFEKDIRPLQGPERAYLTALLCGAKKDYESAIAWFNDAINLDPNQSALALNYLMYVGINAKNYFHRMEIFRLEEFYCDSDLRRLARNAAFCVGNTKLVRKYTLKLSALCDGEAKKLLLDEGEGMSSVIDEFKSATKMTSKEIEELCDEAEAIANRYGVSCIGVDYFIDAEDSAYIIRAETNDAITLAEINMELLGVLSSEKYLQKPITSWFKSDVKKMEARISGR